MKMQGRRWVLSGLVALTVAMSGVVGGAAEQEGVRPHFTYVIDEIVKPDHMDTYMKARIADAKLSAEDGFEFPFLTFVQDFRVGTFGIFSAFAQLDNMPEKMEAWNKKTDGKYEELGDQGLKCVSDCSTSIEVFRPDLSYLPKEPTFIPDFSQPFYQMAVIYYVKPDKHEEAVAVAKKIKALNEKRQSPMGYFMYDRILGQSVPAFVVATLAKDKSDFVNLDKKMQENPDPEINRIMAENAHLLTKIETWEGTYAPEASYIPEGTF